MHLVGRRIAFVQRGAALGSRKAQLKGRARDMIGDTTDCAS